MSEVEEQNDVNFPEDTGEFKRGIVVKPHILGISNRWAAAKSRLWVVKLKNFPQNTGSHVRGKFRARNEVAEFKSSKRSVIAHFRWKIEPDRGSISELILTLASCGGISRYLSQSFPRIAITRRHSVISNGIDANRKRFCRPVGNVLHVASTSHAIPRVKLTGELHSWYFSHVTSPNGILLSNEHWILMWYLIAAC